MHQSMSDKIIKTMIGVGIGPSNLSLAALASPFKKLTSAFFDSKPYFSWHAGLLLSKATLQVSHLEDLVTLVDPTNPYSFLAFLAYKKRMYRFIYANFQRVLRSEFNEYLQWVSQQLENLYFSEQVEDIRYIGDSFVLQIGQRKWHSQHLVLGAGTVPYVPAQAIPYLNNYVFHGSDFLHKKINFGGKRVLVIGGGQSSAEVVNELIADEKHLPVELCWLSRRHQFVQLDESSFVYELFSPAYNQYFFQLNEKRREEELKKHAPANDGITYATIKSIYQQLYTLELIANRGKFFHLLPNHEFVSLTPQGNHSLVTFKHTQQNSHFDKVADIVIFCTGYERNFSKLLHSLQTRIAWTHDNKFIVNEDFSIVWDGPPNHRIYVHNAAKHYHGLADTSLCLMAWRSAKIINSMTNSTLYDIADANSAIDWSYSPYEKNKHAAITACSN